ncbi:MULTISPECIES: transposase [Paenibacillus]|uniref:transposase n=1 Tax=Paenibacillus TaxID=44249 RepID=UPI001C644F5A|nr:MULTISPECIES: transposase [Paenibacillus]
MAKKGQTFRRYSLELKLEAVRLVNEEHMSICEVAKRLDIQNKSSLWMREFSSHVDRKIYTKEVVVSEY